MQKQFIGVIVVALVCAAPAAAQIILPQTITDTYAAKFICGVQQDSAITSLPETQAGRYSSKINVHNNTGVVITFRKKAIRLRGGEVATDPADFKPIESLKEDQAMEVVCSDVYKLLSIQINPQLPPPYIEGFIILEVFAQIGHGNPGPPPDPLDVEGIYTFRGDVPATPINPAVGPGQSIAVVVFPVKRNAHVLH